MARVTWAAAAQSDLAGIRRFIARDSVSAADRLVGRIVGTTGQLALLPHSGRAVPELRRDDIRELIVGRFRVIYRLQGSTVRIIWILHSAQLLDPDELGQRL